MKSRKIITFCNFLLLLNILLLCVFSQTGKIISETVHAKSLENAVTKGNPDSNLIVYLPPGYEKSNEKRYPVIYLLHGIGDTEETWLQAWTEKNDGFATIPDILDKGISDGKFGEMIVVMPDEKTNWFGSFYVNSTATGNWDDFTSKELVDLLTENIERWQSRKSRNCRTFDGRIRRDNFGDETSRYFQRGLWDESGIYGLGRRSDNRQSRF